MGARSGISRWWERLEQPVRDTAREKTAQWRARLESVGQRLMRYRAIVVVVRTFQEVGEDNVAHMAAGIAYYTLFSVFPLLLGLLALFSLFWDQQTVRDQLGAFLSQYVPSTGVRSLITDTLNATLRLRGTLGVLSILGLFWAASGVFGAISRSVNRAWGVEKTRPFYIARVRQLAMAIGVAILFLLSMTAAAVLEFFQEVSVTLPVIGSTDVLKNWAVNLALSLLPLAFSFFIFLAILKFIPNTSTRWRSIIPGALVTAVLFEGAKRAFILYLTSFANYDQTFGGGILRDVVVFMFWVYLSAFILLLGAEFTAELEKVMQGDLSKPHKQTPPP